MATGVCAMAMIDEIRPPLCGRWQTPAPQARRRAPARYAPNVLIASRSTTEKPAIKTRIAESAMAAHDAAAAPAVPKAIHPIVERGLCLPQVALAADARIPVLSTPHCTHAPASVMAPAARPALPVLGPDGDAALLPPDADTLGLDISLERRARCGRCTEGAGRV